MDDKIAVIICVDEKKEYEHIIEELKKAYIPDGYSIDVMVLSGTAQRACKYNNAIKGTEAKYKVFFNSAVDRINPSIFTSLLDKFTIEPLIGIIGVFGSELPIDADYCNAEKIYGAYCKYTGENYEIINGDNPLFYQNVSMIDPNFFAISTDLLFDETVGDYFLMAAYCCNVREKGLKAIVVMQNEDSFLLTFKEESSYRKALMDQHYKIQLEDFFGKYYKRHLPLVSILIPAYNNTVFLKAALESAIEQNYPNLEIIVGDDSTTDDVKIFIEPYLKRVDNIKLYHHGGPLGGHGLNNINFLLGKSNGEYVKLLFHDDVLTHDSISEMMRYYIQDLNNSIGIISSVRDAIDESGAVLGTVSPWIPAKDVIIAPEELIKKVLRSGYNFLGEYSTVLVRKELFWVPELNRYAIGYYKGYMDRHMGDISSWLMIASKGFNCLFLKNKLSYFRLHKAQNTYNPNIQVGSILSWYAFCLLSYNYKGESAQADECFYMIKRMDEQFKLALDISTSDKDDEFKYMYKLYRKIHEFILNDNKDMIFGVMEKYIKENMIPK